MEPTFSTGKRFPNNKEGKIQDILVGKDITTCLFLKVELVIVFLMNHQM